jgi:NADH-quinone oxidoreductase subunit L
MSGEQDMPKMGGLRSKMPRTHLTMLIGCIAIAGIPPLAGFVSKDEILWSAFRVGGYGQIVWGVGFAAAAMTAFYMFRLYWMTFGGRFRGGHEAEHHVHESPASMTVPLMILAAGSLFAGFLGWPAALGGSNRFEHFLEPVFEPAHHGLREVFSATIPGHSTEYLLMIASVAIAAAGIFVATRNYQWQPAVAERLATSFAGAHRVLTNKYYVDEFYNAVFVRGVVLGGGNALYANDRHVIDGGGGEVRPGLGVNGLVYFARDIVARLSSWWDRWIVDGGLTRLPAFFLDNLSYVFRAVQNGLVQHYALAMVIGVLLLIGASYVIPY